MEQTLPYTMKTLLSILAAVTVFGLAAPANAAYPHQRRIVGYSHGVPIYSVYQVVGYNPMGFPIYQWVTQPVAPVIVRPYGYRGYNYRPVHVPPGHFKHGHGHHWGWHHH
jgi:hypothetical protein